MDTIELPQGKFRLPAEGLELEFKESAFALPKSLWESVSSFSNTDGGIIILGVTEKPTGVYWVTGVDTPQEILRQLWNENSNPNKISRPVINPNNVQTISHHGKSLIYIYVPKASTHDKPIYLNGHRELCYVRTDDGDRKATPAEFKYFIVDSNPDVDSELLDNFDMDDLNMADVHSFREQVVQKSISGDAETNDLQFLKDLGVFKRDRALSKKEFKLTVGGLLFFGKYESIRDRFPNFQLDYFRYDSNTDNDWLDRVSTGDLNFPELNVYSFYRLVSEKLPAGVMDKFTQNSSQARSTYSSDLRQAMKEALVNCLMHPYYDGETPIKIVDRRNFTEFINPGIMRVSLESFVRGSESSTRNNVISGLFRKSGIAERAASGGPRIFKSATNNHLHTPDILVKGSTTTVRIWKVDVLSSISEEIELTDQEQLVLRQMTNSASGLRAFKMPELTEAMEKYNLTAYATRKAVNSLVDQGVILTHGKTKSKFYFLKLTHEQGVIENMRMFKMFEDSEMGYRHNK